MGCACSSSSKSSTPKFKVVKPNGTTYKSGYTSKTEAQAAALRVGGTVKPA